MSALPPPFGGAPPGGDFAFGDPKNRWKKATRGPSRCFPLFLERWPSDLRQGRADSGYLLQVRSTTMEGCTGLRHLCSITVSSGHSIHGFRKSEDRRRKNFLHSLKLQICLVCFEKRDRTKARSLEFRAAFHEAQREELANEACPACQC